MPINKLWREMLRSDNKKIGYVYIDICKCETSRRGPTGGCCGKCGGAIPDSNEEKMLQPPNRGNE